MNKPYDLIIIGNSNHSFLTAEYAVSLGARVGLISCFPNSNISSFLNIYKFSYLTKKNFISFQDFLQEQQTFLSLQTIPKLTKQGIHFINSSFTFNQEKKLYLVTANDTLIAPHYLLTGEKQANFAQLNHKPKVNLMTIDQLIMEDKWNNLPENIGVLGNNLTAIYLAIRLQKIKKNVSLFTENNHLLPYEDEDISWHLQLYLETTGIKIYYNQSFNINELSNNNKQLQLIITDINQKQINDDLGLINLGVKLDRHGIKVNSKLQTHHPQIYACGNLLGGYFLENIAEYEGKIAVENALWLSRQKIDYSKMPYSLTTTPPIYRLGYTEKQARLWLSNSIKVITLFPTQSSLLLEHNYDTIYYLKIIVDRQNYIIGFHSLGVVKEIYTAMIILVQNKQPLFSLFKFNFVDYNSIQLVKEIKKKWKEKNTRNNDMIMSLRKTFLIWKNDCI